MIDRPSGHRDRRYLPASEELHPQAPHLDALPRQDLLPDYGRLAAMRRPMPLPATRASCDWILRLRGYRAAKPAGQARLNPDSLSTAPDRSRKRADRSPVNDRWHECAPDS
jgi:hypothetical protein